MAKKTLVQIKKSLYFDKRFTEEVKIDEYILRCANAVEKVV